MGTATTAKKPVTRTFDVYLRSMKSSTAICQTTLLFLGLGLLISSCEKGEQAAYNTISFGISHSANGMPFSRGTAFTTAAGESIVPQQFKYYLSNFSLITITGQEVKAPPAYVLVDDAAEISKAFALIVPAGVYKQLRFWIGVDSSRNVSGVQDGALDPVHGMFWTWNSGYIFAKFEGRSAASTAPLQAVTYHIGGFRTGENALRPVQLNFEPFTQEKDLHFQLQADIGKWFSGSHLIRVASEPRTEMPGPLALKIADNYARMFTLQQVN